MSSVSDRGGRQDLIGCMIKSIDSLIDNSQEKYIVQVLKMVDFQEWLIKITQLSKKCPSDFPFCALPA